MVWLALIISRLQKTDRITYHRHMKKPKRKPNQASPRKVAAARANGKLGGRPPKAARNVTPHLFLGHFEFDGSKPDQTETIDGRFTAVVEATDVHAAVSGFRRLLRQPVFRAGGHFKDVGVDLLSISEILRMPSTGFVAFYELIMRDMDSGGGIRGANLGLELGQRFVTTYGFSGPFLKGPKVDVSHIKGEADTPRDAVVGWQAVRAHVRAEQP